MNSLQAVLEREGVWHRHKNHFTTRWGGKSDFSQQEFKPFLHSQGEGATGELRVCSGTGCAGAIPRDWELPCPAFIVRKVLYFQQRK